MKRFLGIGLIVCALLLLTMASAWAGVVRYDRFSGVVNTDGSVVGEGTGWDDGRFIEYPIDGQAPWWNQWFYNDPPDMNRWKWIDLSMDLTADGLSDVIEVAINWSTSLYPMNQNEPPLVDPNGDLIERYTVFTGQVDPSAPVHIEKYIEILGFNPEWVSIDIREVDPMGSLYPVMFSGTIDHQCVPEPATLVMLVMGALAFAFARRR